MNIQQISSKIGQAENDIRKHRQQSNTVNEQDDAHSDRIARIRHQNKDQQEDQHEHRRVSISKTYYFMFYFIYFSKIINHNHQELIMLFIEIF